MSEVRILNASLDEEEDRIIIRGALDQSTIKFINMGWYQREQGFSHLHTQDIVEAYFNGSKVPDITIGMRGNRTSGKANIFILKDKCYCIDGGQRLYAAAMALRERPDLKISLGAKVFTDTNEEFENEMFCKLGTTQKRIAPSVLLRNRKKKSPAARVLVEMNKHSDFALKDRVTWDQSRTRHELISGYSFSRVVGALHSHRAPVRSAKIYELLDGLDLLVERIGEESLRNNAIRFFDAIDACWTIRQLSGGRESRPHLKPVFLMTLARLMSSYPDFWEGKERDDFFFPQSYLKRLRGFKLADYVKTSGNIPTDALYEVLRKRLGLNPADEAADPFTEAAE